MADQEPATDRQKKKLRRFSIPVKKGLTKAEASELLDAAATADPEREEAYQIAKDREEDAWLLGEIVNGEDAREMGDYKKLTEAQALQLRDYFAARSAEWGSIDQDQMAGIIRHLFPDRIKLPRAPRTSARRTQATKGCLLLLCVPAAAGVVEALLMR